MPLLEARDFKFGPLFVALGTIGVQSSHSKKLASQTSPRFSHISPSSPFVWEKHGQSCPLFTALRKGGQWEMYIIRSRGMAETKNLNGAGSKNEGITAYGPCSSFGSHTGFRCIG